MEQVGVEREHSSARHQDAPRLREGRQKIRYVVQHAAESHRVEGAVRERKPAGVRLAPVAPRRTSGARRRAPRRRGRCRRSRSCGPHRSGGTAPFRTRCRADARASRKGPSRRSASRSFASPAAPEGSNSPRSFTRTIEVPPFDLRNASRRRCAVDRVKSFSQCLSSGFRPVERPVVLGGEDRPMDAEHVLDRRQDVG